MEGMILEIHDANAPVDPDIERMREGVDEDRIVDGHMVETYYCEIKDVIPASGYLRIVGDNDFTDVEIRVLHKTLEALGWIAPPPCGVCGEGIAPHDMQSTYPNLCFGCADNMAQHMNDLRP